MKYSEVLENWKTFTDAVKAIGGKVQAFTIEEPTTEKEVIALEERLEYSLPTSLKEVLLNFSRKFEYRW